MEQKKLLAFLVFLGFYSSVYAFQNLELVDEWSFPGQYFGGFAIDFTVDEAGTLLGQMQKDRPFYANKETLDWLRPFGDGPDDLKSTMALDWKGNTLYVLEHTNKIKAFNEVEGQYQAVDFIMGKSGTFPMTQNDMICTENFLIIAGFQFSDIRWDKNTKTRSLMAYDYSGKFIKTLVEEPFEVNIDVINMDLYLVKLRDEFYFFREDRLTFLKFRQKDLEFLGKGDLEPPKPYMSLPDGFYPLGVKHTSMQSFEESFRKYRTAYSRIVNVCSSGSFLIVQFRSPFEGSKNFQLAFYDSTSFALVKVLPTDHVLLAASGDNLYFHANGDPGLDETNEAKFLIYRIIP